MPWTSFLPSSLPALGVPADQLVAVGGNIQAKDDASKKSTWKEACAKLQVKTIQATGKNPGQCKLGDSGVGGVQIADVSVDTETGLIKINKMVAVQDCGLIIDLKTAESQCYGALIMGITYALFEERIMDQITGRMLNNNMEFYKLAGIGDIGELVVHMMTGPGLRRARNDWPGRASGDFSRRRHFQRRGQRHRRARADHSPDSG